jgi:transposase-like protein
MTKITRDEWSAIAARHAQGESISNIAQTYGCTAPAIHYILRQAEDAGADPPRQLPLPETPRLNGAAAPMPSPPANGRPAAIAEILRRPAPPAQMPAPSGKSSALRANLDDQLRAAAETAMADFLQRFDTAASEQTSEAYQQLRQSAGELMRIAARTTIVVDRLGAQPAPAPLPRAAAQSSIGR